jgi:hypothetical protein
MLAIDPKLIVEMGSGRKAGHAYIANDVPLFDVLALL